jgi:hypothetical protein
MALLNSQTIRTLLRPVVLDWGAMKSAPDDRMGFGALRSARCEIVLQPQPDIMYLSCGALTQLRHGSEI